MRSVVARRVASMLAACLLLPACASPDAAIRADEFAEDDTATYLILSDQLQRVRNVLKKPATVCAATLPEGRYHGIAPVPPDVMARVEADQPDAEVKLEILSSFECLAHYVRDKGPFTPDPTEILVFAGLGGGPCGQWFGGMYNQGNLDRHVGYDVVVENGVARLTGGRGCASSQIWYRT